MRWIPCFLLTMFMLAGCANVENSQAPAAQQDTLRDCDTIGTEEECLSNPSCETFYQPIFEAVPGTNEYARHDVYMNCHAKGALL